MAKGEVIVLLGPSGCGKSTLLRCINGLEEHQGGSIEMEGTGVFGKDISWQTARQKVGMVFQSYELFAHMTVIDNILLGPLKVQKRNRAEAEAQADKLLARVGLLERKNAYPRELSGGQKQRIAIVRALCLNPEVILLDEITAALDPEMVREVLEVVLELAREGMSMLIVTHEMGFARKVADRIVFMDKGAIVEQASPEAFFTEPKTERAPAVSGRYGLRAGFEREHLNPTPPPNVWPPRFSGRLKPCRAVFQTASSLFSLSSKEQIMTLSKKFSTLLAGAVIALGLAACNGGADNQAASGGSLPPQGRIQWPPSKKKALSASAYSATNHHSAMWTRMAKTKALMSKLPKKWPKTCSAARTKSNFVLTEAANRVEYVRSGKVDVLLANFTQTPERAEAVDFRLALHESCP